MRVSFDFSPENLGFEIQGVIIKVTPDCGVTTAMGK
jgi:hypothetical protein